MEEVSESLYLDFHIKNHLLSIVRQERFMDVGFTEWGKNGEVFAKYETTVDGKERFFLKK